VDTQAKTHQGQLKENIGHMDALLDGLRSCGERTTVCQVSVACSKKSNAGPEGTGAAVDTSEGISDKMVATNLETNPEATEAVVERQELCECWVVRRRRWVKNRVPSEIARAPVLHTEREMFIRVQAGTALEEET
jgi:hypothetical protein